MQIEIYSPTIRRKEMDAVLTAMVEDKIGPGEQAKFLIQTAKEKIKFDYCIALRSPAIALYLALKALDLKQGEGVAVSALSPVYYDRVIRGMGLNPIYCDVLSSAAFVGRETVEKALESNRAEIPSAKCIVLHHTLGFVPDLSAIGELGIPIIEDCSQSYGTAFRTDTEEEAVEFNTGSAGVFSILGLEERDMLTSGGGALLFAMNRRDASLLRTWSNIPPEYCLPDINAALAVVQFREAARNAIRRGEIAHSYTQASLRTKHKRFIPPDRKSTDQRSEDGVEYNNYAFPLVLETG